jgi:hypothetical protein
MCDVTDKIKWYVILSKCGKLQVQTIKATAHNTGTIHFVFMRNEDRRIEGEKIKIRLCYIINYIKSFSWMEGKNIYGNEFLNRTILKYTLIYAAKLT